MAGNYADVPGHRMAYDRDGSVGFRHTGIAPVTTLTPTLMQYFNDESGTSVLHYDSFGGGDYLGIIFPELRDVVGFFYAASGNASRVGPVDARTSVDTTNGLDGTWVSRGNPTGWATSVAPAYRTNIQTVSWTGIKAVRVGVGWTGGGEAMDVMSLHLYGSIAAGQHEHRLRIWHPTLDEEVGPAYFDWGNAARSTTEDRTFRLKNNSGTYTATSVTVGIEALTDTSPTVVGQHTFSLDGSTFTATVAPPNIAPGAISGVITLRRTTPANAVLSVWAARIKAEAALV